MICLGTSSPITFINDFTWIKFTSLIKEENWISSRWTFITAILTGWIFFFFYFPNVNISPTWGTSLTKFMRWSVRCRGYDIKMIWRENLSLLLPTSPFTQVPTATTTRDRDGQVLSDFISTDVSRVLNEPIFLDYSSLTTSLPCPTIFEKACTVRQHSN